MNSPLRTALRVAGRSFNLLVGGFMALIGSILAVTGVMEWQEAERVQQESVRAEAALVSKAIERAKDEPGSRTRYLVTYRFSVAAGGSIVRTHEVPVEEWERLEAGAPIPVSYVPHDPQADLSRTADKRIGGQVSAGLGALIALVGFGVLIPALRRIARVFGLVRYGVPVEGTVLELWPTGTTINRVNYWQLSYEYRDHLGHVRQGESGLLHPDEAAAWSRGDRGQVRFDRAQGELSVWVGRPGPETAPSLLAAAGTKLWGFLKVVLGLIGMLAIVFVAAVIGELPPVKELGAAIDQHKAVLAAVTVGILVVGVVLLMGGILWLIMAKGEPMSHGEVENAARSARIAAEPTTWRASSYKVAGTAIGKDAADAFSAKELKEAARQGALLSDPVWRRRLMTLIGALMAGVGLFGVFVVIGPNWVKVLCAGALLYAAIRLLHTWRRA